MIEKSFYKQTTLPGLPETEVPIPPMPAYIGPYKIESLLSKGGMSFLYLGLHPETKQALAIKVLSPKFVTHPEAIDRFLKEAQIITLADHPNIVKLYGEGKWEGGLYIAMEFIRGVSLRQFILQHSLSLKRSLDIILQVAYALLHLHTHGVIHRDLKPENILITEDGQIKVIDFGIAQLHEEPMASEVEMKRLIGTPIYMSPEQKENPESVSFVSDIYSLGIIIYELVLGKLSYGVLNLSLLPKGLKKIVEKTLAISVKERYQDIVDVITDISQYLKSESIEKDRPGSDQLKEFLEDVQKAQQLLSPFSAPNWPLFEIGIAKHKGLGQFGWYYDFFKLPNNTYAIVLAESTSSKVEQSLFTSSLRGMVKMFLHLKTMQTPYLFQSTSFVSKLNQLISEDPMGQRFAFSLIVLDPLKDQLSFISCGLGGLLHLPLGAITPRKLPSQNMLLGVDPNADFFATEDNWYQGDTLILHSLEIPAQIPNELENQLIEAISENLSLSAQGQAEAILKKVSINPAFALQKSPKVLLTIQRIS